MPSHSPKHPHATTKISIGRLLQLMIIGLVAYVLIAGFTGLRQSLHAVEHARVDLVLAAAALVALSYVAAAVTYCLLVVRPVPFFPTLLVQIAGGLVNRLLPAGLGGLGLNALYIHRHKHSIPVASTIVATNNTLGFIGNILLIILCVIGSSLTFAEIVWPHIPIWLWFVIIAALLSGLLIARFTNITGRLKVSIHEIVAYFKLAMSRPGKSSTALLSSMIVTGLHASALYLVITALGITTSWAAALVAISAGAFAGAAVPTPGGLGGAEAGIAAALIALSTPASIAVTAALLYRGLTYWLPLLPGYLALRVVENRYI